MAEAARSPTMLITAPAAQIKAMIHVIVRSGNEGTKISASDLKPGDLIFYGNGKGNINHVAIYIGGGQVIHASSPKTGIKISSYKYRTPVKCVRVIQD